MRDKLKQTPTTATMPARITEWAIYVSPTIR